MLRGMLDIHEYVCPCITAEDTIDWRSYDCTIDDSLPNFASIIKTCPRRARSTVQPSSTTTSIPTVAPNTSTMISSSVETTDKISTTKHPHTTVSAEPETTIAQTEDPNKGLEPLYLEVAVEGELGDFDIYYICSAVVEALNATIQRCSLQPSTIRRELVEQEQTIYVDLLVKDADFAEEYVQTNEFIQSMQHIPENLAVTQIHVLGITTTILVTTGAPSLAMQTSRIPTLAPVVRPSQSPTHACLYYVDELSCRFNTSTCQFWNNTCYDCAAFDGWDCENKYCSWDETMETCRSHCAQINDVIHTSGMLLGMVTLSEAWMCESYCLKYHSSGAQKCAVANHIGSTCYIYSSFGDTTTRVGATSYECMMIKQTTKSPTNSPTECSNSFENWQISMDDGRTLMCADFHDCDNPKCCHEIIDRDALYKLTPSEACCDCMYGGQHDLTSIKSTSGVDLTLPFSISAWISVPNYDTKMVLMKVHYPFQTDDDDFIYVYEGRVFIKFYMTVGEGSTRISTPDPLPKADGKRVHSIHVIHDYEVEADNKTDVNPARRNLFDMVHATLPSRLRLFLNGDLVQTLVILEQKQNFQFYIDEHNSEYLPEAFIIQTALSDESVQAFHNSYTKTHEYIDTTMDAWLFPSAVLLAILGLEIFAFTYNYCEKPRSDTPEFQTIAVMGIGWLDFCTDLQFYWLLVEHKYTVSMNGLVVKDLIWLFLAFPVFINVVYMLSWYRYQLNMQSAISRWINRNRVWSFIVCMASAINNYNTHIFWSGMMPKHSERFMLPITIHEKGQLIKSRLATVACQDFPLFFIYLFLMLRLDPGELDDNSKLALHLAFPTTLFSMIFMAGTLLVYDFTEPIVQETKVIFRRPNINLLARVKTIRNAFTKQYGNYAYELTVERESEEDFIILFYYYLHSALRRDDVKQWIKDVCLAHYRNFDSEIIITDEKRRETIRNILSKVSTAKEKAHKAYVHYDHGAQQVQIILNDPEDYRGFVEIASLGANDQDLPKKVGLRSLERILSRKVPEVPRFLTSREEIEPPEQVDSLLPEVERNTAANMHMPISSHFDEDESSGENSESVHQGEIEWDAKSAASMNTNHTAELYSEEGGGSLDITGAEHAFVGKVLVDSQWLFAGIFKTANTWNAVINDSAEAVELGKVGDLLTNVPAKNIKKMRLMDTPSNDV